MESISALVTITLLPMIVGFVLLFVPNKLKIGKYTALVVSALSLILAIRIFTGGAPDFSAEILKVGSLELSLDLAAKPLGSFMLLAACGFGLLITVYSFASSRLDTQRANEYFGSLLLTIGGSAGILLSQHLLVLLICWEIVTASLYLMITTGTGKANFAGTKTFALIGASDGALLLGVALLWHITGTFAIADISIGTDSAISVIAFLLLLVAALTKAGAMPLHTWMPTSGEHAPVAVMALLPAAIDKLLGIYLLVVIVRQLFTITSPALSVLLSVIGAATIIVAVMIAMVQHNLKKLLSYHAISQVGYMVLGIATGTPIGLAGGVFHMINHAIYKCCLFLCGGAVEQSAGTAELEQLGGLGKKMPITFAACMVAALSISGIPPFNGFVSKWMVYQGVIETANAGAKLWPIWLVAAMFGSALTLASFVKIIHSVFLSRPREALKQTKEAPLVQLLPMVILAGLCIFFGVFYTKILGWFIYPALGMEAAEVTVSTWQSTLATALLIIGIVIGVLIWLLGKGKIKVRRVSTWYCGETIDNEKMVIPGTHFYKTVSEMNILRQLYAKQEKMWFDLYDQGGRVGLAVTGFLKWLHSGVLPVYLTWVTVGLLALLFVLCDIW